MELFPIAHYPRYFRALSSEPVPTPGQEGFTAAFIAAAQYAHVPSVSVEKACDMFRNGGFPSTADGEIAYDDHRTAQCGGIVIAMLVKP
jgi:hypothetical protein